MPSTPMFRSFFSVYVCKNELYKGYGDKAEWRRIWWGQGKEERNSYWNKQHQLRTFENGKKATWGQSGIGLYVF